MLFLAASLFFSTPVPMDMPRAEAYLVKEKSVRRLEDRYSAADLWLTRTVLGRWLDEQGRVFVLSRLENLPPALSDEETVTRAAYVASLTPIDRKQDDHIFRAIDGLSTVEPVRAYTRPHHGLPGFQEVRYYQGTNSTAIICAFLPHESDCWYAATWDLLPEDDLATRLKDFESIFLASPRESSPPPQSFGAYLKQERERIKAAKAAKKAGLQGEQKPHATAKHLDAEATKERELLREDARRSIAAYASWHMTDAQEFTVLDNLTIDRSFVTTLTNDLSVMRRAYAEVMPSPLDGSNTLCVARLFATREEYLEAAGEEMAWSAAFWNPQRRELVAYLPLEGTEGLLKTFRHEAFHQYFSYACCMLMPSPWINEGYAQYFEDPQDDQWGFNLSLDQIDSLGESIPSLLMMDYRAFYAGTPEERRLKYRLAWSLAYFLEKGAPLVRAQPFKEVKRQYVEALLQEHEMGRATCVALGGADQIQLLVREWKRFWKGE